MSPQKLALGILAIALISTPVRAHEPEKNMLRDDRGRKQGELFGSRAYLGVSLMKLTPQLRDHYGVKQGGGLVTSVDENSPALKAGIRAGDVIVSVDGKQVERSRDIANRLRERKAGEAVRIEYVRGGSRHEATATLIEREQSPFDGAVFEEMGPIAFEAADQMLRMVNSPEWKATMTELQARIRELETRLRDLEKKTRD